MARGTAVGAGATPQLTVWFDGDCPICAVEIGVLRRLDRRRRIAFIDLCGADLGLEDRAVRLARLHARPDGGAEVTGAAAFVAMWRVLPPLRPFAALFAWPPAMWALERAYRLFLIARPRLQALVRRRTA
jgi:predicted DCC family thiol-disulfide oxidoreductase YuxK